MSKEHFRKAANIAAILFALFALTTSAASQRTARNAGSTSPIRENALRAHIKFLSDDRLEGRGTGAKGGELAALYIAGQFEAMGLKGAGAKGSFWQPVSLVGVKADPKTELVIRTPIIGGDVQGAMPFKFGDDFVAFTGAQTEQVSANAELVFVGYGIDSPEQKWNDYKGPAEDYRGKILVMLVNDPPATAAEPDLFGGRRLTYYGRWTYKYEEAARRGAVGVILLHTTESAGYGWNVVRTSNGSWRFDIARTASDKTPFLKIRSWMTDEAAHRMFALAGQNIDELRKQAASREFKPVKLNLTGSIDLKSAVNRVEAPNVVATLPGRDPKLRDEYVVITAHWDHLGVGAPNKQGDTIYNGALDNATGVASVLEIARVLSSLPAAERPKRSILFLLTTAEEQGLIGAEWYTRHPLVPINKTAANINLDSMNILGPTHDFVPLGAERSSLKAVVDAIARERGLRISPDARPEQGSFYRSDHFPFAKAGVPAISLKEGSDYVGRPKGWGEKKFQEYNQANYHQPSDEFRENEWNFLGLIQEADFAMALVRRIADLPAMPKFNPDDEFAKNSKR